jgi:hypothetical protein
MQQSEQPGDRESQPGEGNAASQDVLLQSPEQRPRSRLRWLIPLLSLGLLLFLIWRATPARAPADAEIVERPDWLRAEDEPPPASPPPGRRMLSATKAYGIEGPSQLDLAQAGVEKDGSPAAQAPDGPANAFMAGSKWGFGGLGLRGTGRTGLPGAQAAPDPGTAEAGDEP